MAVYGLDVVPICDDCEHSPNQELMYKFCMKCDVKYCTHFSSATDIRFCANCISDFKVIETIETKTTERISEDGSIISRKRQIAKNIRLEGMDWLFQAQKIGSMNDEELGYAIEYHAAIKSLLMNEREERRILKFKKLQNVRVILPNTKTIDGTTSINGNGTGTKRRIKTEKKAPDANAVAAALSTLLGHQFDPAALATALANLKKK